MVVKHIIQNVEVDKEYILLVGRNRFENDDLVRYGEKDSIWFHLDEHSGPHFILVTEGDEIPKRYLNEVARMFAKYKSNLGKRFNVIYTELRNVKTTKEVGTVIPVKTKVISVRI
jgi:predicted ribosome quality control (RQC) complex YloA/Tae2 family protein